MERFVMGEDEPLGIIYDDDICPNCGGNNFDESLCLACGEVLEMDDRDREMLMMVYDSPFRYIITKKALKWLDKMKKTIER